MNVRKQVLVSAGTIGAMLAGAAGAYHSLPARLAVHWNIRGEPSGFLGRDAAVLILPALAVVLTAAFALAPAVMPARSRLERSAGAWSAVWMAVLATLCFSQALLIVANLGVALDVPRLCALCVAGVFLVVGNWLGKVRYNFVFGIRTPWTLADERVWDRTHRFTGRLMVGAAIVLAAAALALPASSGAGLVLAAVLIACAAGPALAGVIYSALGARPVA